MNIVTLFFFALMSWAVIAQSQKEQDLIFCSLENYPNLEVKITKTHDKLYTLYSNKKDVSPKKWHKIMDLDEPVVWTKNGVGEVADFYSLDSYNYWLRLFFNNSYEALGHGEFLLPKNNDQSGEEDPDKYVVQDCQGTLK